MEWPEVLKNNGFTLYDKCNCHGQYTEKYTDAEKVWNVYVKPRRMIAEIYKFSFFKGSDYSYNIQKLLEKHGISKQAT